MRKNLIIVPVGKPVDHFIKQTGYPVKVEDHWRMANNERNYDIMAVQYGDFVPEEGTYDDLCYQPGFKWTILKQLYKNIDMSQYEYIGLYDDDVILDYCSMNSSFELAKQKNFKAFQISLAAGSESSYPCTQNMPGVEYTDTNFIEVMCPVFRKDALNKVMELINKYDIYTGWGLDYVLSEWLDSYMNVIHDVKMLHPSRPDTGSGYDKSNAFREMGEFLNIVFPKAMEESGRKVRGNYNQFKEETFRMVLKV
jgi:hypothetical protein